MMRRLPFRLSLAAACALAAGCAVTPRQTAATDCPAHVFPIYFAMDQGALDPLSEAVLDTAAAHLHGCEGGRLEIAGFADAVGDPDENQRLSAQRADAVLARLLSRGVHAQSVTVLAVGDQGALTEDGVARPMRRRVEVRFLPVGL